MYLVCPNCNAEYEAPAGMVPDGGRHVQCSACHTRWFATNRREARLTEEKEILKRLEARAPHLKVVHDRQDTNDAVTDAETVEDTAAEAPIVDDTTPDPKPGAEPEPKKPEPAPETAVEEPKPEPKKPEPVEAAKDEKPDTTPKADYTTSESHVDPADLEKFMSQKVENPPKPDRKRLEPAPTSVMGTPAKPRPKPEPVEDTVKPEQDAKPAEPKPEPKEAAEKPAATPEVDSGENTGSEEKKAKKPDGEKPKKSATSKPKEESRDKAKAEDKPAKPKSRGKKKKRNKSSARDAETNAAARETESLASLIAEEPEEREENRFLRGFAVPVAGFALLLILYVIAGFVSSDFPAVGPVLAGLEEVVDGFRRAMAIVFPKEG